MNGRYQVSAATHNGVYRAALALPTRYGQIVVCAELPHDLLRVARQLACNAIAAGCAPPAEVGFAPLGGALLGSLLGGGGGGGGGGLGGALGGLLGGGGGGGLGGALSGLLGGGGGGGGRAPTTGADGRARPGASGGPEVAPGAPPTGFYQAQPVGGGAAPGGGAMPGGGGAAPGGGGFDPSWVPVAFTTAGVPLYRIPPGVAPSGQSPMGLPIFPSAAALDALAAVGGNRPAPGASTPGLTGMMGAAAAGAVPPELAAPYLGGAQTVAQAMSAYGDVVGPVAQLLRGALRAVDAGAAAELGDPRAAAALARARSSSEARVAEALRLAGALVQGGAPLGAALGRVASAV